MDALAAHLVAWLRDAVAAAGAHGVVVGLSGGVDSSVAGALATRAFPTGALGVLMPCHSDPADAEDAAQVARHFDLPTATVDLGPVFDALVEAIGRSSPDASGSRLVAANIKPRLRMTTLYAFANLRGALVVGTDNLDELTVGYFTKYGDGGVDLLPLGNLTKGEVRDLARALGVPPHIVEKPPSAGLWAGQTDEGELGLTYEQLDAYLLGRDVPPEVRARIEALHEASAHKRAVPPAAPRPDGVGPRPAGG